MAEHTPGPWRWQGNGKDIWLVSATSMLPTVMNFVRVGMNGAGPRFSHDGIMYRALRWAIRPERHNEWKITGIDHPDARLIAAAPEMYAALQLWDGWWDGTVDKDESIPRLLSVTKAALAKAHGETHG